MVGLGEATHGAREFFRMKHRLLEFLVEEMGFTIFAIEGLMPESFDIDRFVVQGEGDAAKALAALHYYTWNTEEMLELIQWMRKYNSEASRTRRLRFYGCDMTVPARAAKEVLRYLRRADWVAAASICRLCAEIQLPPARRNGEIAGGLRQKVDATPYRERRVRLRAFARTEVSVPWNQAHLWLVVNRPEYDSLYSDAMWRRPITSPQWREYEIVAPVEQTAVTPDFGLALVGEGRAWLDELSIETLSQ